MGDKNRGENCLLGLRWTNETNEARASAYWLRRLINHWRGDELLDSDKLSPFEELAFGTYTFHILVSVHRIVPSFSTPILTPFRRKEMECDNDASSCMHACIRIYIRGERDNAVIFLEFSILGRDIKSNITMKEIREGIDRSIDRRIDRGPIFP